MAPVPPSRLIQWRKLFISALSAWLLLLLAIIPHNLLDLQKDSPRDFSFGVFTLPGIGIFVQDYSYNILCLQGIHEHLVARPYRMEDQEQMVRQMIPAAKFGMTHAYSPVALVLALPLLYVPGFYAYLIYFIASISGILLLFYYGLLPKAVIPMQFGALALCLFSICTVTAFEVGQTAMLTTVLIGTFWILLQQRHYSGLYRVWIDFTLALLFWALCFKPSVAIGPFFLLVGARSWRVLALGMSFLFVTWTTLCGYYGGWWTGLPDHSYLLNHYHNAGFTPFMQRDSETAMEKTITLWLFSFDRTFLLVSSATAVILHWTQRITLSELFQIVVWLFLLFSPYLLLPAKTGFYACSLSKALSLSPEIQSPCSANSFFWSASLISGQTQAFLKSLIFPVSWCFLPGL